MAKTNICDTDCAKTFAEQFQDALADICLLGSVSGGSLDRNVSVSPTDPNSSTLINKLQGTSGINFDVISSVSGQIYQASLDLQFLDDRYENQTENVLTFPLNGGIHNGHVVPNFCLDGGFESLRYPDSVRPSSSWNTIIPKDFMSGISTLNLKWTHKDSVSGIVLFDVKYNSVSSGDIISLNYNEVVSGFSDGVPLKLYETEIDIASGIIERDDVFILKLTRLGNMPQDNLNTPIELIGVSLKYREV